MTITPPVALLQRMDPSEITLDPELDTVEEDELAYRASDVLGYEVLAKQQIQREPGYHPLLTDLLTIGITPFTQASVDSYKKSVSQQFVTEHRYRRLARTVAICFFASIAAVVIGAFLGPIFGSPYGFIALAGVCLMVICIIVIVALVDTQSRTILRWATYDIGNYQTEMPRDVLQLAVSVKEACPAAALAVEEIVLERAPRPTFDPFLVVKQGEERYYVAVWDEPNFAAHPLA